MNAPPAGETAPPGAWESMNAPPAREAAPPVREEAHGIAGMAFQGLAWAGKAIFGEAPRAEPESGLAWAGKALFGEPAPAAVERPATLRGREESREDQWARVQALDARQRKVVENHEAFMEKLRNF